MISNKSYSHINNTYSTKHLVIRLVLIKKFIEAKPNSIEDIDPLTKYIITCTNHDVQEVRTAALRTLLELYVQYGFQYLEPELRDLNPDTIPLIIKSMPELEDFFKLKDPRVAQNPQPPKKKKSEKKLVKKAVENPACEFCGKIDKQFTNRDLIDLHLTTECVMLNNCQYCSQLIEVSQLNIHYVDGCENQDKKFKQCKKCKYSYQTIHKCDLAIQEGCVKCALCAVTLQDTDESWRNHLMIEKCPRNKRKNA